MKKQEIIRPGHLEKALSYEGYLELIDRLLEEGKSTGPNQSDALTHYSKLNRSRMKRLDKTFSPDEAIRDLLQNLERKQIWVVLTEGWCGDAAQNVPVLAAFAANSPQIEFKILLRDEHPEIMDAYLTNGGRGIPKLIVLDAESLDEIGTWGPRPVPAQQMVMDYKANPVIPYSEFLVKVQEWYNQDRNRTIQEEFKQLLQGGW